MEDDFRIAVAGEVVGFLETLAKFRVVVNFPVEDDPVSSI
jgi:hypothetical protein